MDIRLDLDRNPYGTHKRSVTAKRGAVATSQPLGVEAGLEMLRRGGNAVDAAVAAAIAMTVVEPESNGIGSDAFALVWEGSALHGLNGSGRAPAALTLEEVRSHGHDAMPAAGWMPVTIPGAPALWRDLHARFGKLPLADLFQPAIRYADEGYPVTPTIAADWDYAIQYHATLRQPEFAGWMPTYGREVVRAGMSVRLPDHAATLRRLATLGVDDLYSGELAHAFAGFAAKTGGYITTKDLAAHRSTWVEPISTNYKGYDVWEMPPNGQGITALMGLNILEGLDHGSTRDTAQSFHAQIESLKLAFADALWYVADPDFVDVPVKALLDKGYAERRRALIGERALLPRTGDPHTGGTIFLCAADSDGMMVSLIQSGFQHFGSGIVVPGTGISLQNRGSCFALDPRHPNCLAPGKRPYHTIIPAFLTQGGEAIGPLGVMGMYMQPQGHMQMVSNTIDYAMHPQASLDAPRWQWTGGRNIMLEADVDREVAVGLRERGHDVSLAPADGKFGRGQIIWRLPSGEYVAGSDKRGDGFAGAV